jgi:hypothetical protein
MGYMEKSMCDLMYSRLYYGSTTETRKWSINFYENLPYRILTKSVKPFMEYIETLISGLESESYVTTDGQPASLSWIMTIIIV